MCFVINIAFINQKMLCFMYNMIHLFFWCLFRTVTPQDKSFALGIQFMLFRVLGKQKILFMQNRLIIKKPIKLPNPVMGTQCSLNNTNKVTFRNISCMSKVFSCCVKSWRLWGSSLNASHFHSHSLSHVVSLSLLFVWIQYSAVQ